jgi:hypothetical protein
MLDPVFELVGMIHRDLATVGGGFRSDHGAIPEGPSSTRSMTAAFRPGTRAGAIPLIARYGGCSKPRDGSGASRGARLPVSPEHEVIAAAPFVSLWPLTTHLGLSADGRFRGKAEVER